MTNRGIAKRYARALFDVALKEADPSAVERDLAAFADLLKAHPSLQRILTHPAVPTPRKRAIVSDVVKASDLQPVVKKLLIYLAERDRLQVLPDLLSAYRDRLMDHLKIVRAEVTTAIALPDDRVRAIERSLAQATGKQVTVSTHVDPTILGGVVTRVGSLVYDGSLVRQLQRMKEELIEQG